MEKPRWVRDLLRFLPLKSQFVLSGNVRDHYPLEVSSGVTTAQPILPFLAAELRSAGIRRVLRYEPIHGFSGLPAPGTDPEPERALLRDYGLTLSPDGHVPAGLDLFAEVLTRVVTDTREPVALLADFAARMLV